MTGKDLMRNSGEGARQKRKCLAAGTGGMSCASALSRTDYFAAIYTYDDISYE